MTVDKFGGQRTDDRSSVSLNVINKSFVRRDGGNTVTGSIDNWKYPQQCSISYIRAGCSNESLHRFKQRCTRYRCNPA